MRQDSLKQEQVVGAEGVFDKRFLSRLCDARVGARLPPYGDWKQCSCRCDSVKAVYTHV